MSNQPRTLADLQLWLLKEYRCDQYHDYDLAPDHISRLGCYEETASEIAQRLSETWIVKQVFKVEDSGWVRINILKRD